MTKSSLHQNNNFTPPLLRNAFDGLADAMSNLTGLTCPEPTLAQQQFADEADINTIVNKFLRTGELPEESSRPQFGDFTQTCNDYQTALNLVIAADSAFAELPAKIRTRFNNNPAEYVQFFEDPKNQDEAIALGLATDSRPPQAPDRQESGEREGDLPQSGKSSSKASKKASGAPHDGGAGD